MERITRRTETGKVRLRDYTVSMKDVIDKCAEYEDLEEQGRLIRLHFGISDVVYEVEEDVEGRHNVIARKCATNAMLFHLNKKVGKTVFLTRTEAEQALADMEKEN